MKMICNKAKTCPDRRNCPETKPHDECEMCKRKCSVGMDEDDNEYGRCVPVKPTRKPVTVWRVYIDFDSRADARADAKCLREECWHHDGQVRGPVKVGLP